MAVDLRAIAREARDAMPGHAGDSEVVEQYALRLLTVALRRESGMVISDEQDQALRSELIRLLPETEPCVAGPLPERESLEARRAQQQISETALRDIVAQAFSAPTDGSAVRARVLASRACRLGWSAIRMGEVRWGRRLVLYLKLRKMVREQLREPQ